MLVACRLAGLFALEAHYAGLAALTQTEGENVKRAWLALDSRPSIVSPSVKNAGSDKRHDESD